MRKKRFVISLTSLLIVLGACEETPKGNLQIHGTLPKDFSTEVQYAYLLDDNNQVIDSAKIEHRTFDFDRQTDDSLRLASIDVPQSYRLPIILEEGKIKADFKTGLVYGTPLNDGYKEMVANSIASSKCIQQQIDSITKSSINTNVVDRAISKLIFDTRENDKIEIAKYLAKHPNDEVGILVLRELLSYEGITREEVTRWRAMAQEKVLNDPFIKERYKRYDNELKTQEGAMFSDFEGLTTEGKATRLSNYAGKGKYILLDFWASWCVPCRYQLPKLKKIYKQYHAKGLEIVGVAVSDKLADHQRAVREEKLEWQQIVSEVDANNLYGIRTIPQLILLSPEGKILSRGLNADELSEKLAQYIK